MKTIDHRRASSVTSRKLLKHWRAANLLEEMSVEAALAGT
jgi:hypothetical protein